MAVYRPLVAHLHKTVNRLRLFMARHPQLVVAGVALVLSLYFHSSRSSAARKPPITVQQTRPRQFFQQPSPILDFPYGNLNTVGQLLEEEEVLFVMYYAPWCSKSIATRPEFEKAASYLQNEIQFVGINCWYKLGECRHTNKFLGFPVLFFYTHGLDGFVYRGPLTGDYMVSFIQRMLRPLVYLRSDLQIAFHIAQHDNSIISFFNFTTLSQPPGVQQFHYAAMRVIEADPLNIVPFGVITDQSLAVSLGLHKPKSVIFLRAFNSTLLYPVQKNFTSSAISAWVQVSKRQPLVRLHFSSGIKSLRLSSELLKGPTLLVFVPYSPLEDLDQYKSMVLELAYMYSHCPRHQANDLLTTSHFQRWKQLAQTMVRQQECAKLRELNKQRPSSPPPHAHVPSRQCCQCVELGPDNGCSVCRVIRGDSVLASHPCRGEVLRGVNRSAVIVSNSCRELRPNYNPVEHTSLCCGNSLHNVPVQTVYAPKPRQEVELHRDPYINNWLKNGKKTACRKLMLEAVNGWQARYDTETVGLSKESRVSNITYQGCNSNRSLTFLVLSSSHSAALYRKFHVQENASQAAVIVDVRNEKFHVMKEEFSQRTLSKFILNHTVNVLEPTRRSSPVHTTQHPVPTPTPVKTGSVVTVMDVNTETFNSVVMDVSKDVVVMFYSQWCGFCSSIYHTFLSLARYFRDTPDLTFTRIDADRNDLPWHLTVEAYPTIIMFPAKGKSESVRFPDNVQKTLPNLVVFILLHSSKTQQLDVGLKHCSPRCMETSLLTVTRMIQRLDSQLAKLSAQSQLLQQKLKERQAAASTVGFTPTVLQHHYNKVKLRQSNLSVLRSRARQVMGHLRKHLLGLQPDNSQPVTDMVQELLKHTKLQPSHQQL